MELSILFSGFLFGYAMQYAQLNKFNTISGMSTLEDFTMAKTMSFAIGLGSIIIAILVGLNLADYHIKPLMPVANIFGGILFGIGMSILGYCPGTLPISLGQGAIDALFGIIGGLTGGLIFTIYYDQISPLLGPDMGKLSLYTETGNNPWLFYSLMVIIGVALIKLAFNLHTRDKAGNYRWLVAGLAFALINSAMILNNVFARPIGASTAYPYTAAVISNLSENSYLMQITSSGKWQIVFLLGAFLAGLIPSLYYRTFRIKIVQERWKHHIGNSRVKRLIWAFIGGFLLIFGARIAGGCASGHILSGVMQMSFGSLLFTAFTFIAFLLTGRIFYKTNSYA